MNIHHLPSAIVPAPPPHAIVRRGTLPATRLRQALHTARETALNGLCDAIVFAAGMVQAAVFIAVFAGAVVVVAGCWVHWGWM